MNNKPPNNSPDSPAKNGPESGAESGVSPDSKTGHRTHIEARCNGEFLDIEAVLSSWKRQGVKWQELVNAIRFYAAHQSGDPAAALANHPDLVALIHHESGAPARIDGLLNKNLSNDLVLNDQENPESIPTLPGALLGAWIAAVGKDLLPPDFSYKPHQPFMKRLIKADISPAMMTAAGALYRAWIDSLPGKPILSFAPASLTVGVRQGLGLVKADISPADVSGFMADKFAETTPSGQKFWRGKVPTFDHVAMNIATWKASKHVPTDESAKRPENVATSLPTAGARNAGGTPLPGSTHGAASVADLARSGQLSKPRNLHDLLGPGSGNAGRSGGTS